MRRRSPRLPDIDSLGAVVYEMLVRPHPFDEEDVWRLLGRLLTEAPRPILELRPGFAAFPGRAGHADARARPGQPSRRQCPAATDW